MIEDMNLSSIKDIFLFQPIWQLFSVSLSLLSLGQCGLMKQKKASQISKKSNKSFNTG